MLPNAFSLLADGLQELLVFLRAALSKDLELLSDKGRDRMFTSASSLLEKINLLLCQSFGQAQADSLVGLSRSALKVLSHQRHICLAFEDLVRSGCRGQFCGCPSVGLQQRPKKSIQGMG